jgi:hypothetical protein
MLVVLILRTVCMSMSGKLVMNRRTDSNVTGRIVFISDYIQQSLLSLSVITHFNVPAMPGHVTVNHFPHLLSQLLITLH